MFSVRDLIDVWGLPHLNKVGKKCKENRISNGEFIDFLSFSCEYEVFIEEIVNQIRKFSFN